MAIETALDQGSDLLSRPDFLLNFGPGEHKSDGDALFSKLVGVGATRVEPTYVRQDIERLSGETEKIERYVNKRIAHRDAQAIDRRKFGELDKCLRLLEELRSQGSFGPPNRCANATPCNSHPTKIVRMHQDRSCDFTRSI